MNQDCYLQSLYLVVGYRIIILYVDLHPDTRKLQSKVGTCYEIPLQLLNDVAKEMIYSLRLQNFLSYAIHPTPPSLPAAAAALC